MAKSLEHKQLVAYNREQAVVAKLKSDYKHTEGWRRIFAWISWKFNAAMIKR